MRITGCPSPNTVCSDALARFDVYRGRRAVPFLVQVQGDFLDHLFTRSVVPLLIPNEVPAPTPELHFLVKVEGQTLLFATHLLAAIPRRELGPPVASVHGWWDEIGRALDRLLTGG